ncbi:hypothetical protein [Mesorhizobium sp. M0510]|uniref:hypothetical protein n=1 Tax=unclassified Mesorhizobium TaxID=325217 RepID=UPI003338809D
MSYKTFRRLTGRRTGGAKFVREFSAEMVNLGWLMVRMPSALGFVRATSVDKWPRTKSNLVAKELKLIDDGALEEALNIARQELGEPGQAGMSLNGHSAPVVKGPAAKDR